MLDLDVQPYQRALETFFMPLFAATIIACFIVCWAILPILASAADACSGGGNVRGGPDDTVLTVYRNLAGEDLGSITNFVGFYTQQCNPDYYPFKFLSTYLNGLDNAIGYTSDAVSAFGDYEELLEAQCGRKFGNVLDVVEGILRICVCFVSRQVSSWILSSVRISINCMSTPSTRWVAPTQSMPWRGYSHLCWSYQFVV